MDGFRFQYKISTADRSFIAPKTVYGNAIDAIKKEIQGYKYKRSLQKEIQERRKIQIYSADTNTNVG